MTGGAGRAGAFFGRRKGKQACAPRQAGLVRRRCCRALRRRPRRSAGRSPRRLFPPPGRRGLARDRLRRRRASAGPRPRQPARRLHRLRALRQRHGQAAGGHRRRGPRQRPPLRRRRRRRARRPCRTPAFDRVYLLYPDPWPKRRHHKRRFVSDDTAGRASRASCARAARSASPATSTTMSAGRWRASRARPPSPGRRAAPDDWREPFPGWPGTRYEAKALREGRVPSYLTFERTGA